MKKQQLKSLIKEIVEQMVSEMEPYDDKTDAFAPGPRDRQPGEEDMSNPEESEEIKTIKLARDYAFKAKGNPDVKLKQITLVTIESMLTELLKMHGTK